MMNVAEVAVNSSVKASQESLLQSIILLYFQYHTSIELDEILITYFNAVSQHDIYRDLIKERAFHLILMLIDR